MPIASATDSWVLPCSTIFPLNLDTFTATFTSPFCRVFATLCIYINAQSLICQYKKSHFCNYFCCIIASLVILCF
nr:MAG TPA: hypothetical protein [Caudoviricetes sp.]